MDKNDFTKYESCIQIRQKTGVLDSISWLLPKKDCSQINTTNSRLLLKDFINEYSDEEKNQVEGYTACNACLKNKRERTTKVKFISQ